MTDSNAPERKPLVVAGPSGSGKSTLIKRLLAKHPDDFGFSVSHTTRAPRQGEEDGVAYYFSTREEMDADIEAGLFIESAEYSGNLYGTSFKGVEDVTTAGKVCILDIDMQGVRSIAASDAIHPTFLFIKPPSIESLRARLEARGTGKRVVELWGVGILLLLILIPFFFSYLRSYVVMLFRCEVVDLGGECGGGGSGGGLFRGGASGSGLCWWWWWWWVVVALSRVGKRKKKESTIYHCLPTGPADSLRAETEESLARRLGAAEDEMNYAETSGTFDHTIVNDDLNVAAVEFVAYCEGLAGLASDADATA